MVLGVVRPCGPPSAFLLVVGASGLCTPGPVRLDGVHRPPRTVPSAGDSSGRPGPSDGLQGRHKEVFVVKIVGSIVGCKKHGLKNRAARLLFDGGTR